MKDDKIFLDTNVLVYAYDLSAGRKRDVATGLVADLWKNRNGILSTQVLQEFYVSVTKKIPCPISATTAKTLIEDLLLWEIVPIDGEIILMAIDLQARYVFSFWDALIISAALRGGACRLLSEDLQDGRSVEGLTIENPFR